MSGTLAIAGAGPMLGMATARAFGARGYRVALVARRLESLESMVAELSVEGIDADEFVADLRDEAQVASAFEAIANRFGPVDVVEFSPLAMTFVPPSQVSAQAARDAFEFLTVAAINVVRQVLPAMQQRGKGALLFASGRSSLLPMKLLGSLGLGTAALRHYVYSLHEELAGSGIYVGTVPILARMDRGAADEIAALFVDMVERRGHVEIVYGQGDAADAARDIAMITARAAPFEMPRAAA